MKDNVQRQALPDPFHPQDICKARNLLQTVVCARFNNQEIEKIRNTIQFIEERHRGDLRRGTGAPYAIHPIRVALSLIREFNVADSELVCAALLHDTVEDTGLTSDVLGAKFGARCAELVDILTRRKDEGRGEAGDYLQSSYLQRVNRAGNDAIVLKLADKLDNLRDAIHHPDKSRVIVFVNETFSTYIPLARALTAPLNGARSERLLLESAAETGDADATEFLAALINCISHSLANSQSDDTELREIPFPKTALKLYLFLNPEAKCWIEFDGASLFATRVPHLQLAAKIAHGLQEIVSGRELDSLVTLAGLPAAFASGKNRMLWNRVALHLMHIQRLLREPNRFDWFAALTSEPNLPLLIALIQSRIYLPASWRSPLWSKDLGTTLSQRVRLLANTDTGVLIPRAIAARLALTRYIQGSGTLHRAESVLDNTGGLRFSPAGLWALRIASEYLEMQTEQGADDRPEADIRPIPELDRLWDHVKAAPYQSASLPERGPAIALAEGPTHAPNQTVNIEMIGLDNTRAVFERADAVAIFQRLIQTLIRDFSASGKLTWIDLDALEWEKRRTYWSRPNAMRPDEFDHTQQSEEAGVRVISFDLPDYNLLRVLPARRFALQDRLPEIKPETLDHLTQSGFTAVSMFDAAIMQSTDREMWLPRIYRILDSIEDLDPENVQAITVSYEGPEDIPPLTAHLPLPCIDDDPEQQSRKRFIARYIVAQIYNCAVVRWVRRVKFTCSAVSEAQVGHAFTEEELMRLLGEVECEYGYRLAYANFIERYGYEPFLVLPSSPVPGSLPFGREQIESGRYLGIDIGGSFVKFEMFLDGEPLTGTDRPSMETPKKTEVSEFCRTILLQCNSWMVENGVKWSEIDGIGISWPGAVRENRLAGASGVLRGLYHRCIPFRDDDPINRLPDLQLSAYFQEELGRIAQASGDGLNEHLAISIQNDGDAEALGNYALRVKQNGVREGGKIFVKLGTSVAGGRITAEGTVAEEVAEYAKIVLNLNCAPDPKWPGGTARYYASAVGVRQLTRTFLYEGELLFGEREGLNDEVDKNRNNEVNKNRIEPVELGMLLPLVVGVDGIKDFLAKLVKHDNQPPNELTRGMASVVEDSIRTNGREMLISYMRERSSLDRVIWLCTGENQSKGPLVGDELPKDFPFAALARTIVGTVCLFSQLSLQLSHLIAQLYNVYRRGAFSEVVLSGGVLAGETGALVETQAKAFLIKYYDKIYGPNRPLVPSAVTRSEHERVSNAGVFGAAMAANRMRQVNAAQAIARAIHYRMKRCAIGKEVHLDELIGACPLPQAHDVSRGVVEAAVVAGSFIWIDQNFLQRIS